MKISSSFILHLARHHRSFHTFCLLLHLALNSLNLIFQIYIFKHVWIGWCTWIATILNDYDFACVGAVWQRLFFISHWIACCSILLILPYGLILIRVLLRSFLSFVSFFVDRIASLEHFRSVSFSDLLPCFIWHFSQQLRYWDLDLISQVFLCPHVF